MRRPSLARRAACRFDRAFVTLFRIAAGDTWIESLPTLAKDGRLLVARPDTGPARATHWAGKHGIDTGQMRVKCGSNAGQMLVKCWSDSGRLWAMHEESAAGHVSNTGQTRIKHQCLTTAGHGEAVNGPWTRKQWLGTCSSERSAGQRLLAEGRNAGRRPAEGRKEAGG